MVSNWAIVIGINQYRFLQPLKYAKRDAEAMQSFLMQEAKFNHIFLFTDDSPPIGSKSTEPFRANLLRVFGQIFASSFMKDGDNFWFFFSGHGIRHQNRDYLMPEDGDPGNPKETAVEFNWVTERLSRSGAGNIVLILDACRQEGREGQKGNIGFGKGKAGQKGMITLFACQPNESSWEINEPICQGSFTHVLLKCFTEQNLNSYLTIEQTEQYLQQEVSKLNGRYGKPPQTPLIRLDSASKAKQILLPHYASPLSDEQLSNEQSKVANASDLSVQQSKPDANQALSRRRFIKQASFTSAGIGASIGISYWIGSFSSSQSPTNPLLTPELITRTSPIDVQSFTETLEDGVMLEMVQIPGGKFKMGSLPTEAGHRSEEGPQHEVTVTKFAIGKYPVTQAQWRAVAALPAVNRSLNPTPAYFQNPNHPVEQISWLDAIEFCLRLSQQTGRSYRLPTEAEWEYACRAGTTTPYYFGDTLTKELANYSSSVTTSVGSFTPNAFGLHDMHGNVWECCADYWRRNYEGAPLDGSARSDPNLNYARVIRGGSWNSEALQCRSAKRTWYVESTKLNFVFKPSEFGMRVACSL
jgi:formylglycine-generating enzyme required for sulfatase activity